MIELGTAASAPLRIAEQLHAGLCRLGKPVAVIAGWRDEARWATGAVAVSELGADTATLLLCIDKNCDMPLAEGGYFCVNILRADQINIARACGDGAGNEAWFSKGRWGSGACGSPYLREAQANFFCEYETHFEYGTHAVVIGAVREVDWWGEVDPLIYVDGGYARAVGL